MKALLKYSLVCLLLAGLSCGDKADKKNMSVPGDDPGNSQSARGEKDGVMLFFGNSLTAGMGLDPEVAFPARIQAKLDSLGYSYTVVNAGLSGETTASGRNRLDWVLDQKVSVFILELGANDGLRGIALSETRANLQAMITKVRQENPDADIILAGMQIPPNMGPEYTAEFRNIFPELAEANHTALIPFLLKDVGGVPELNQEDGIHPTKQGHQIIADTIWPIIEKVIRKKDSVEL
jgi:acyl-CoA thioesterase-1